MVVNESTFLLFSDSDVRVDGGGAVEREWNYLLFRDSVEGPDVVLQVYSGDRVDGEGDSEKEVDYLLFQGQCRWT